MNAITDFIAAIKEAMRTWKRLRTLKKERAARIEQCPF